MSSRRPSRPPTTACTAVLPASISNVDTWFHTHTRSPVPGTVRSLAGEYDEESWVGSGMLQVSPSSSLHDWYNTPSVVRMNISSRPSPAGAIEGSSHGNIPPKPSWCQM